MTNSRALALAIAILASAPAGVHGHGRMTAPAARSGGDNGCVAGGPGTVHAFSSNGEHHKYQHGICGNAPGTRQTFNAVKDVQAIYTAGDTITIEIQITAHHVGYFEFDLCLDAGQLSEECFDQYHLLREGCECMCPDDPSNSCEECRTCRWYWKAVMEGELGQTVTRGYAGPVLPGAGNLVPYDFRMSYVLPSGVRSSNAVLRWHYMTTNSCTSGASAPEEFWNCADITIQDEAGDVGPAISYDNEALESMAVPNLMPAITSGALKGINYACPVDAAGDLLGVGTADEYYCGEASEDPGPFEYCTATAGSAGAWPLDCTTLKVGINCQEECGLWFYECAHSVVYLKPAPPGTKCKGASFVPAAACDDYEPSPKPGLADPDWLFAPTSPTPAPGPDASCARYNCDACLASNNVCYPFARARCDLHEYAWCGGSSSSLLQTAEAPAVDRRGRRARKLRARQSLQPWDDSEVIAMLQHPLEEEGRGDVEGGVRDDEEIRDEL